MTYLRDFGIRTAIHGMETLEKGLDFLFVARPYIPFAGLSLLAGFLIGLWITFR